MIWERDPSNNNELSHLREKKNEFSSVGKSTRQEEIRLLFVM